MLRRENFWSGSFSGAVEMLLLAFVFYNCSKLYPDNKISYKFDSLKTTQCHAIVPAKMNLIYLMKIPLFLINSLLFLHLVISNVLHLCSCSWKRIWYWSPWQRLYSVGSWPIDLIFFWIYFSVTSPESFRIYILADIAHLLRCVYKCV